MSQIHPFFHKILDSLVEQDQRELMPEKHLRRNALVAHLKYSLSKEEERSKKIDQTFSKDSLGNADESL